MKYQRVIILLITAIMLIGIMNVVSANEHSIECTLSWTGELKSQDLNSSAVINGSGELIWVNLWSEHHLETGQNHNVPPNELGIYRCYLTFNTSVIPSNHMVISANISVVNFIDHYTDEFDVELYNIDYSNATLDYWYWYDKEFFWDIPEKFEGILYNNTNQGSFFSGGQHVMDVNTSNINIEGFTQYRTRLSTESNIPFKNLSVIFYSSYTNIGLKIITTEIPTARIDGIVNNSQQSTGEMTLDGTGSSDGDGTIENYTWEITHDGVDEYVYGESPTFDLEAGDYTVMLTVTDDLGATNSTTMMFTAYTSVGFLQLGLVSVLFLLVLILIFGKIKDVTGNLYQEVD